MKGKKMYGRFNLHPYMKRAFVACILFLGIASRVAFMETANDKSWLDSLYEQGRKSFYQTIIEEIKVHPKQNLLTETEKKKIMELETRYRRLYEILINVYYQKDEPIFRILIEHGSEQSRQKFRSMFLDLARFAGHNFVECFFHPSPNLEYIRKLLPAFRGKDKVDLIIRSVGYFAKLDIPEPKKISKRLSPEFDKQWGLDAGRFREAHRITKGEEVRVAVLDSGIDMTHPIFRKTRMGNHFSLVGREGKPWATDAPLVDWGWHGTNVSSVVARYAPEAQITMYKRSDADTQNNAPFPLLLNSFLAAAIYRAVHDGNDVINISAGSNVEISYSKEACQYAYENNVIIVTGSPYYLSRYLGNDKNFTGQYDTTISVTAIERRGEGEYGYWEIAAPEVSTTVSAPNGIFCAAPYYVNMKDEYGPSISLASPAVASLIALVISVYPRLGTEGPGEYFETIKKLLIENANPEALDFQGFSPECGYGLIDAEKTVKNAALLNSKRLTAQKNQ